MKNEFLNKYHDKIQGIIGCYDRVVLKGTLHEASHAGGMMNILNRKGVRFKDYPNFVKPYRDLVKANAIEVSKTTGIPIEFIRHSKKIRKEELVRSHIEERGIQSGLVSILSAMERCNNYRYKYDKSAQRSILISTAGKCLHYYFYIIDPDYGLCYLRVPTWCPFQLQFYFNGHNWLARQMDKVGLEYELQDNAFVHISDYVQAQILSDKLEVKKLHERINEYATKYCREAFNLCPVGYRWTIMQVEYATDLVFKSPGALTPIYDEILKTMMHTVTPDDVARFLGRKKVHGKNNLDIDTSYRQVRRLEMRRMVLLSRCTINSLKCFE